MTDTQQAGQGGAFVPSAMGQVSMEKVLASTVSSPQTARGTADRRRPREKPRYRTPHGQPEPHSPADRRHLLDQHGHVGRHRPGQTGGHALKQALKSIANVSVSEDSGKVFVNIPSKKNYVTIAGVAAASVEALKTHLAKSGVQLASQDYKEKEQSYVVRTAKESDAAVLQTWFKTNLLEVQ